MYDFTNDKTINDINNITNIYRPAFIHDNRKSDDTHYQAALIPMGKFIKSELGKQELSISKLLTDIHKSSSQLMSETEEQKIEEINKKFVDKHNVKTKHKTNPLVYEPTTRYGKNKKRQESIVEINELLKKYESNI